MAGKGRKLTQAELEQDEVALTIQELIDSLKANRVKLLTIAAAAALMIMIGVGYKSYRERVRIESSEILNKANGLFLEIPRMGDEEERKKKLQETIGALQTLIDRYKDSPAAREALYLEGNCYFYMDESGKAKELYQSFINQAGTDEERARGEIALGYAIENEIYLTKEKADQQPHVEEAKKHFQSALEIAPPKSYLYYFALMSQARILELTSHDQEALDIYSRVVAERPSPVLAAEGFDPNKRPDFSGGLMEFAKQQVTQQLSQLSLFTTAMLRKDRLEAQIESAKNTAMAKGEAPANEGPEASVQTATPTAEVPAQPPAETVPPPAN